MTKAALKAGTAANSVGEGNATSSHQPVTVDSVASNICDAMSLLSAAFCEMEQRIVADNGKRYPLNASLPNGVEDTGSIELVNRYAFLERNLVGTVMWKLEQLAHDSADRISQQREKIKQAVRQVESGRTDIQVVERMADYLDTMEEQHVLLTAAYNAGITAHADILGEDYETRAIKADRALAQATAGPNNRLAALRARVG